MFILFVDSQSSINKTVSWHVCFVNACRVVGKSGPLSILLSQTRYHLMLIIVEERDDRESN